MSKRARSFAGCSTCRQRKLKCDEKRPRCGRCITAGIRCGFDTRSLHFREDGDVGARFRQVLYTEAERQAMSDEIAETLAPGKVHDSLLALDTCQSDSRGPFGVFPVDEAAGPGLALTPYSDFALEILDLPTMGGFVFESEYDLDILTIPAGPDPLSVEDVQLPLVDESQPALVEEIWPPFCESTSMAEAAYLLNHYTSTTIRSFSPFEHSKTPWHILFVSLAKNCMASISLGEDIDHATMCVLHGMLAVSAYSLYGIYGAEKQRADNYRDSARLHIKKMLMTAYDEPKTAKYKSMLMALLVMVQLSTVTSNQDQIDCYLLEAEKLIRIKGLRRRKTRKVRLLHHCYAFDRIVYESLYVNTHADHRQHVQLAIVSSGSDVYSRDSLVFELCNWDNLDEKLRQTKSQDVGENDLHLQHPGSWHATMYPEIFGVPEHWVMLLSLTVRLARHKARLSLDDYLARAKSLEQCILRLQPAAHGTMLDHLLRAMQHALAIYFFRQIYDLDASLLQTKVAAVQDCLIHYQAAADCVQASARMVWPVFIAACEADEVAFGIFSQWFERTAQTTGFDLFRVALEDAKRIRQAKAIS